MVDDDDASDDDDDASDDVLVLTDDDDGGDEFKSVVDLGEVEVVEEEAVVELLVREAGLRGRAWSASTATWEGPLNERDKGVLLLTELDLGLAWDEADDDDEDDVEDEVDDVGDDVVVVAVGDPDDTE